ncbi:MAG: ISAs1 family transposase [Gammaproteobacteria bacterium]
MDLSDTFLDHFAAIEDPRLDNHNRRHELYDILVITILGTICSADTWTEICEFAHAKIDWLKTFLKLPNGIPSDWVSSLSIDLNNEIISIDGKTLRGSANRRRDQKALHLVSAWASNNRIMLGQIKTQEKSNEIEAIPKLLKMIDVKGGTVTIDAQWDVKKILLKKL